MKRLITIAAVLAFMALPAVAAADLNLKITDHGTTCSVTSNNTVECIGKLSGLGSTTTDIRVLAGFTCFNKPGNVVHGQSGGESGPINPQNGQVTFDVFTSATTGPGGCTTSDGHTVCFDATATINVVQNGEIVFTEQVPISGGGMCTP